MKQKIKETNMVLAITMVVALMSGDIYYMILTLFGGIFPFLSSLGFRLVFGQFLLIFPTIIYVYMKKINWIETLSFHKIKWSSVLKLVILAYLLVPILAFINGISLIFSENQVAETLSNMSMEGSLILNIFIIALIPCLVEESIFRGLLYGRYRKISFKKGILLSGFLFGLMHFNINQFCYAFVMGIIFAMLLEGTGSILAPIIVHFTINSNSIIMQYLQMALSNKAGQMYGAEMQEQAIKTVAEVTEKSLYNSILFYGIVSIFTAILAYKIFGSIVKKEQRTEHMKKLWTQEEQIEYSMITIALVISIILGIGYLVMRSFL